MAVIKRKRNPSKLQALYDAHQIRNKVTRLLLRDFGAKPKVRTVEQIAKNYKMTDKDAEQYLELTNKYEITNVLEEFPYWFIADLRESVCKCLREMAEHITIANSIYPNSLYECDLRRQHQDIAIGQCEFLLQELQYIMGILPVNVNKLMPFVEMVDKEVSLLKAWRKSDNSMRNKIIEKELAKYAQTPHLAYPYIMHSDAYINSNKHPLQIYPTNIQPEPLKVQMCTIVDKRKEIYKCDSEHIITGKRRHVPFKSCSST